MLRKGDKYLILSFDTESDIGSWTQDYTSIDKALPLILDMLSKHDVRATFYWEGMAAMHAPDMVRKVSEAGHECGCHTFQHETVGKPSYFIPGDRAILPDEVHGRLVKNKLLIEQITGHPAVSFRAPRLWGDEVMIRALEDLGFATDSTYQVSSEEDDMFFYHPSENELGRHGSLNITELPVMAIYGDMTGKVSRELRDFGEETGGGGKVIGQWPVLRLYGAEKFLEFAKPYIDKQLESRGYSVVTVYQHPWEFIPMPGVLDGPEAECRLKRTLYQNTGDIALEALDKMISGFKKQGFRFVTASGFAAMTGPREGEQ